MGKSKDTVVNVNDPCDIRVQTYEGGFTLIIESQKPKSDSRLFVKIKFDRWWIVPISEQIHNVIKFERTELERLIQATGMKE